MYLEKHDPAREVRQGVFGAAMIWAGAMALGIALAQWTDGAPQDALAAASTQVVADAAVNPPTPGR